MTADTRLSVALHAAAQRAVYAGTPIPTLVDELHSLAGDRPDILAQTAGLVDDVDAAEDGHQPGIGLEQIDGAIDGVRHVGVVGVDPVHVVAGDARQRLVHRVRLPAVGLGDPGEAGVRASLEDLYRAVGGRSVHHQVLVGRGQRGYALEELFDEVAGVEDRGDDGEGRQGATC